jgi:hypothetical protein
MERLKGSAAGSIGCATRSQGDHQSFSHQFEKEYILQKENMLQLNVASELGSSCRRVGKQWRKKFAISWQGVVNVCNPAAAVVAIDQKHGNNRGGAITPGLATSLL